MRQVDWTDSLGRKWRTILPMDVDEAEARMGAPVGPPDLSGLDLPEPIMVRLHNQLHARGIFTFRDARRRTGEIVAALQAAYRTDAQRVVEVYHAAEEA